MNPKRFSVYDLLLARRFQLVIFGLPRLGINGELKTEYRTAGGGV